MPNKVSCVLYFLEYTYIDWQNVSGLSLINMMIMAVIFVTYLMI